MSSVPVVDADRLLSFATKAYQKLGVPEPDARLLADTLVQADLWGHQSHGVLRLGWYAARIESGVMRAHTEPAHVIDAGALGVIDGNDGIGQVLTAMAAREAVDRAKKHGIG